MPSSWTAYSKRKSHCQADILEDWKCLDDDPGIVEGEPIGRVRYGTTTVDFHPICWLEVSIGILLLTPYAPKGKGRRKLPISDEERVERRKIQSRYSAFQTRITNYSIRIMNEDLNQDDLRFSIEIMKLKQDKLWYQIQKLGGAPDKWRVPDGNKKETTDELVISELLSGEQDEGASLDTA